MDTQKESHHTNVFTSAVTRWENRTDVCFGDLVSAIHSVHQGSTQSAVKAVNRYATMRNWLIGLFIVEYQQKGRDRAEYGEKLLKRLEESLQMRGLNVTLFQNSRLFYVLYPQVGDLFQIEIQPTVSVKSVAPEIQPTASAFYSAQRQEKRWSNMPPPDWTASFLCPPICYNCQTNPYWSNLSTITANRYNQL